MIFSSAFISTEPGTMLARYAVLPSPALASGPQVLLLSKLKAPINHAESTLLQVFFLKNLKPFGINTFEKQGEGSPLWLTSCYKKVSARKVRRNPSLPSSVHSSKLCRLQLLCLLLACPERSRRIRKHRRVGLFLPFWKSLHGLGDEDSHFFQVLSFHILAHSFAPEKTQLFSFQAIPHSLP